MSDFRVPLIYTWLYMSVYSLDSMQEYYCQAAFHVVAATDFD
jgi:hypothetical protein